MERSFKNRIKKFLTILALLALFLFFFATPQGMKILGIGPTIKSVNVPFPEFTLYDIDEKPVNIGIERGKALLINFFSVKCSLCMAEIASLKKIAHNLTGQPFELIAISEDWDIRAVKDFVYKENINFRVLLDRSGEGAQKLGVHELPTSFIVNPNNKIVKIIRGPILDEVEVTKIITDVIKDASYPD